VPFTIVGVVGHVGTGGLASDDQAAVARSCITRSRSCRIRWCGAGRS
jgi:hypothetical protein